MKNFIVTAFFALSSATFAGEYKELSVKTECPICLEDNLQDIAQYPCGHAVCKNDYESYSREAHKILKNPKCPLCNEETGLATLYSRSDQDEYEAEAVSISVQDMYPDTFVEIEDYHRHKINSARLLQAANALAPATLGLISVLPAGLATKSIAICASAYVAYKSKDRIVALQNEVEKHKKKIEMREL